MTVIPSGSVTDTTRDTRWTPVRVTAYLAEPVLHLYGNPLHLDGPLSWAGYLEHVAEHGHHTIPPIGRDQAVDFALPLATWTASAPGPVHPLAVAATPGHVWGWACSAAHYIPLGSTAVSVSRRPAVEAAVRYTRDNRWHLSTGPLKARLTTEPAVLVMTVTWWALAEPERLASMLARVHGLGRKTRHGHGRVLRWKVEVDDAAWELWRNRVWPDQTGQLDGIRAPYHHHTRRMPCRSWTPPA